MIMKVGTARTEPNQDPYCPPPTGRLQFSWNPFYMSVLSCFHHLTFNLGACKYADHPFALKSYVVSFV